MKSRTRTASAVIATTALALGACGTTDLVPDLDFERDRDFQGRVYAGAGALVSQLEPDTDDVPGVELDEDVSAGGTVALGYDVSNRFAVEGSYSSLGEATLSPDGAIDYQTYGLSALVYGFNDREARALREGFSAFGRLGVGGLQNDSDVPYERVNDVHLLAGLGLEYGFANGIGVRLEAVSHETDARYAQLGLVYRFGDTEPRRGPGRPSSRRDAPGADAPDAASGTGPDLGTGAPGAVPVPAPRADARAERAPSDVDRDGVPDAVDDCPDTLAGRPVDAAGCALFEGAVEGVTFLSASDELTPEAEGVLEGVAGALADYPAVTVAVEAHTDNTGDAEANLQLSRRRAVAVARFLVSRGIEADRLKPRAFGESRPRQSNATAEGRAANRRVEFGVVE